MANKSTQREVEISQRRRAAAALYLAGKTQAEIARQFNVSQQMISKDLAVIRAAWLDSALMDFDEIKGRELARIDRLEGEYWQAWARSQKDAVKTVTKQEYRGGQLTPAEARVERAGQAGDPRFLAGVQ